MERPGRMSFWIFVCLLPCTFTLAPVSRSIISVNFCCEDGAFLKTELVPSQFGFARTTAKCTNEEESSPMDQECKLEPDIDYLGSDIPSQLNLLVDNQQHCANLCLEHQQCLFWFYWSGAFGSTDNKCWLKKSDKGRRPFTYEGNRQDGGVSGQKACGVPAGSTANVSSLEWERTQVKDLDNGELMEMSIRKSEANDVHCYNTITEDLDIHISGSNEGNFQNSSGQDVGIRLVGGYSDNEGNVLINGQPICDDSWDMDDANVACRMLGFEGAESTVCCSEFGSHGSTFIMDDLHCNGNENSLFECEYESYDDCGSSETAGVRCRGSPGPSGNFLTGDGGLVSAQGVTWEPNSFCLAPKSSTRISAVKCFPSMAILPTLLATVWSSTGDGRYLSGSAYKFLDANGNGTVEKDEFDNFVNGKIETLFNILDTNSDGGINVNEGEGTLFENLPFKLFEKAVEVAIKYYDMNKDNKITLLELNQIFHLFPRSIREPNLSDVFGGPMISLPGPFYKLYSLLDRDHQEDLSLDEAMDFLRATFSVLDGNNDCKLSSDELVTGVANAGFPDSYGAAVEITAQQYITLGDFILTQFFKTAGQSSDGIVTMDLVVGFDDWDWFEEKMVPLAINVGYPNLGPASILSGDLRHGRDNRRITRQKMLTLMLTALQTILDNPGFDNIGSLDNCME